MSKRKLIDELYRGYVSEFEGHEIVLGEGSLDARLLLIGEAPGKDEVKQAKPFVGMAGKNLNEFLDIIGLERQSIYITNTIKFRLSKVNEKTGRTVNRPAAANEIRQNAPYLHREISIIKPEYIVTLGNVPLKAITGNAGISIGAVHGEVMEVNIENTQYKLFPLFHPASIIYNQSLKDTYLKDIEKLKVIIGT